MKLLIAGGGTGGHVFPALAVAGAWLERGAGREVVMAGTQRGLEARLVPAAGLPLETIRVAGLKGMGGMKLARNAAMLPVALWDSLGVVRRHRFAAALGVGGYASGPVLLAAALRGVPCVVFEPNATPGLANRILARLARHVACGFEETAARFGSKAVVTGVPVRAEFFAAPRRAHAAPFHLLVTGGSQGALPVNRAMVDALDRLAARKQELRIVHQSGQGDYNAVRVAYARREFNAEVLPFLEDMPRRFAQADLIVCRSGAVTAAEVAAAGRAALFIPFGHATDSHQMGNARALERAGAARVIPEAELSGERLAEEILSLLAQPERLAQMEQRARTLARPRAVEDLAGLLEGVARR